ncbi:MAG: hypothetical protein ACE5G8_06655, partial [Anaerolineae bacterium]
PPTTPHPAPGSTAFPVAAANSATTTPPPAGPAPLPQKETAPPPKPVTFILGSIFTPNRLVLLVVLGAVLFTLIYFIQFRLWTRRRH